MSTRAYLGLDVGGTGAKAGVYDATGRRLGAGQVAYTPTVSPEGHVELPIETVYAACRDAARAAIAQAGVSVAALAIATQGQTFVSLDAEDRPLHPAIVWYDSRAAREAAELAQAVAAAGERLPESDIAAIATAPKILWLRRHHPAQMARARRYLLLPDYLAYRLTGDAATDPCTASSTGLYRDDDPDYSPTMLAAAQISREELARIQPAGAPIGRVRPAMAAEWGLSPEALLVTGTNDQYAGALGAGNCRPGILSVTTGTCLALVTLTEQLPDPLPEGLLGGRFPIPRYQFALCYSKTAGVVLDWFRRVFCPERSLAELEALAAQSPPGSNGVTMLHHFDGMVSPRPNADARGAFCGLSLSHGLGDLYRAILESLAFSLRENQALMRAAGLPVTVVRALGGGARSDLLLQIDADVCGLPVERPAVTEAATLGAALLAVAGAGEYGSVEEASERCYRPARVFTPNQPAAYEAPFAAYRAACRRLHEPEPPVPAPA